MTAGLICVGVALNLWDRGPVERARNAAFDQFQIWHPRIYQDAPVRIIDIDEESLKRLGQWPWPRTLVAELVSRLQDAHAAAIAFDFVFSEPDRTSPKAMLELWKVPDPVRQAISTLPEHDQVFAEALKRGGVVLAFADRADSRGSPPVSHARYVTMGESPQPYVRALSNVVAALPELQSAAAGAGAINFIPDSDGVIRRVPMILRMDDTLLPSLSAEALRVALGAQNFIAKMSPEAGTGLDEIRVGKLTIPTTSRGEVWLHYSEAVAQRSVPAWKVLAGQAPREMIENNILLVGTSANALMDLRHNALGRIMPGVQIHAQALEQILAGETLNRPPWAKAIEPVTIVLGGLILGLVALTRRVQIGLAVALPLLVLISAGAWFAFTGYGLLLDPVTPTIALAVVFTGASTFRHLASERDQRWIKEAFARYVSPNLVEHLVNHPDELELGGQRLTCSFIFTDLAGFTTLLEKIDPSEAGKLLNPYLDQIIAIVFKHHGTLTRIIGDAVVVMFSAPVLQPDHQRRAMLCALEIHDYTALYAEALNASGVAFGQTRIGIHTGEVIVGNFGGSSMFDYRALGDPINTAARLESVNKHLGTLMCASEATLRGCPDVPARPVGRLVLKGKSEALMVFQPLQPSSGEPERQADPAYRAAYELMKHESEAALDAFEKLAAERPRDPLVALHLNRLRRGERGELIVMAEK